MEARTIGWSIAVAVIATFGFVAMFAIERETSSRDLGLADAALNEAKRDLESSQSAREKMKERVEEAKKLSAAKASASIELAKIEAAITAASRKKEDLKKAWQTARSDYEASVTAVRRKLTGTKYARLDTAGLSLTDVTLKSILDGVVSLDHSAGLTKLPAEKLPADLASALLPDWNPQLKLNEAPAPAPGKTVAGDEPDEFPDPAPDATAPHPQPQPLTIRSIPTPHSAPGLRTNAAPSL
jgi:hypothetical protein